MVRKPMKKLFLYSMTFAVAIAVALTATACLSTAPDGDGSKNSEGIARDPAEILAMGDMAPSFDVKDQEGTSRRLADLIGKSNVVLIFYPGNETPGCTAQLCTARDDWKRYKEAGVQVFGVNPADAESHADFAKNHSFPFPLLADVDGRMVRDYGTRGLGGVVKRTVYGIDQEGKIVFAQRGTPATTDILAAFGPAKASGS
jgi:peroxiredoxin Q/BCP